MKVSDTNECHSENGGWGVGVGANVTYCRATCKVASDYINVPGSGVCGGR